MSPFRVGIAALLVTVAADQASKLALLFLVDLPIREPLVLGPFLNLIVVWNRGISYGLFQQHSDLGRILLLAVAVVATVAIAIWLFRAQTRLLATALGLIAGGAVGNAIDRVAYGAVFDFVQVHVGSRSWYIFNVADIAIVAGVIGLIYDALFGARGRPEIA
jgi:signal peptidase II